MTKAADVHHVGSSGQQSKTTNKMAVIQNKDDDLEDDELLAEDDYGLFDMDATPSSPTTKKAKKKKKEKNSSSHNPAKSKREDEEEERKEEVVVEKKRRSDSPAGDSGNQREREDDDAKGEAGDSKEEEEGQHEELMDKERPDIPKPEEERKDEDEEEEEEDDTFDVRESNRRLPKHHQQPTIEMDPRARANRRASQGGDLLASHVMQSETLRYQLRLLAGRSDESGASEPESFRRREVQTVELDIGSDDDLLPTVNSSRSNSVVGESSSVDGDNNNADELPPPPPPLTLPPSAVGQQKHKLVRQASPIDQDLSQALDESFDIMSMDYRQSNSSSESPLPPAIVDASNKFVLRRGGELSREEYDNNNVEEPARSSSYGSRFDEDDTRRRRVVEEVAALIQSPSPDSGIHDFADTLCSSPVSELAANGDESHHGDDGIRDKDTVGGFSSKVQGRDKAELIEIVSLEPGDDKSLVRKRDSKPMVVVQEEGKQEEEEEVVVVEKVAPPRQHTLDRVLFSMSSYKDRRGNNSNTSQQQDKVVLARSESVPHINNLLSNHLQTRLLQQQKQEEQHQQQLLQSQQEQQQHKRLEPVNRQRPVSLRGPPTSSHFAVRQLTGLSHAEPTIRGHTQPPLFPRPKSFAGTELEFSLPPSSRQKPELPVHPPAAVGRDNVRSRIIEEFEARTRRQAATAGGEEEGGSGEGVTQAPAFNHQSGTSRQPERTWRSSAPTNLATSEGTQSLDRMMGGGHNRDRHSQPDGANSLDREQLPGKYNSSSSYNGGSTLTSLVRERQRRAEENLYDCPRSLLAGSYSSDHHSEPLNGVALAEGEYDEASKTTFGRRHVVAQPQNRYSGPPSVSLGVWGENGRVRRDRVVSVVGDVSAAPGVPQETEDQLYARPRHRQPPLQKTKAEEEENSPQPAAETESSQQRLLLSRKVSSADMLLPAAHWLRPELKPKPIEIRYRNGSAKASHPSPCPSKKDNSITLSLSALLY